MESDKPETISKESQDFDVMKYTLEDLDFICTIGTGRFSRVMLVRSKECPNKKPMALKLLKKHSLIKEKQVEYALAEKQVLGLSSHPFITKLLGTFQDQRYLYFVLEYACGGELFTRMKNMGTFSASFSQFYAAEIILALEYLHSKNVVYRDLKPENILLDKFGHIKLADFGFAKEVRDKCYSICGTSEYLAPEIILNKGHGMEVDWWALGVLVYEMLTGNFPFTGSSPQAVYQKILMGRIHFPANFEPAAISFISGLLEQNPSKRIGFKDGYNNAKSHEWLSSIDFCLLISKETCAPWVPEVESEFDTRNFDKYPETSEKCPMPKIMTARDPFMDF